MKIEPEDQIFKLIQESWGLTARHQQQARIDKLEQAKALAISALGKDCSYAGIIAKELGDIYLATDCYSQAKTNYMAAFLNFDQFRADPRYPDLEHKIETLGKSLDEITKRYGDIINSEYISNGYTRKIKSRR